MKIQIFGVDSDCSGNITNEIHLLVMNDAEFEETNRKMILE